MDIFEIPFGSNASEIESWECTISEVMEEVIKDGKIIFRQKASEDERIRRKMIEHFKHWLEENLKSICHNHHWKPGEDEESKK